MTESANFTLLKVQYVDNEIKYSVNNFIRE